ncbi:hypothetical protein [Flavobacterium daemonense]|uniref:hypothetical protein n=1 Tax=Flavobacterium daemonense TaxID=1393049 RepID=UPI0011854E31|nr:hypothetical protein [Flavobacterium daemonense]KAF2336880.1 hypothetical protein FND99_00280 [Flavobacterium daemonense]
MKTQNFKENYNSIKDNLSILILIPTIIGGIWQLLELSLISTSFIRFFSITQLVADGILILFIISILYIAFNISGKMIKKNDFQFDNTKPPSIWYSIITIPLSIIVFFFIPLPLLEDIYKRQSIKIFEIVLLIPIMTITVGLFFLGVFRLLENFIYNYPNILLKFIIKIRDNKKFKENFISIISTAIILISVFFDKTYIGRSEPLYVNLPSIPCLSREFD